MKTVYSIMSVVVAVLAVGVSGCAARQLDMVAKGEVSLVKTVNHGVHITWAEVRQDGDYVVVTGSILPRGAMVRRNWGHVEVELLDSQGELVGQGRSSTYLVRHKGSGRGLRLQQFRVAIQAKAPVGGHVRVGYHLSRDWAI